MVIIDKMQKVNESVKKTELSDYLQKQKECVLYRQIINDIHSLLGNKEADNITENLVELVKILERKHNPLLTPGLMLIAKERIEQIEKHGKTIEVDIQDNKDDQLIETARILLCDDISNDAVVLIPEGWSDEVMWKKMCSKSFDERIIIAAALLCAEVDRKIQLEVFKGKG